MHQNRLCRRILAGVDMLMAPDSWKELYGNTLREVRSGEIPAARIDDAVRRILRVKAAAGLLGGAQRMFRARRVAAQLGSRRIGPCAEAVRKSLVLLKNEHAILPLDPRSTVLVAGDAADDIGLQAALDIDWQATTTATRFSRRDVHLRWHRALDAGRRRQRHLDRDGRFANKPDAAIVVFGEGPYAEFEGTARRSSSRRRPARAAAAPPAEESGHSDGCRVPVGPPLWVNAELNASDAFVAAWLPAARARG